MTTTHHISAGCCTVGSPRDCVHACKVDGGWEILDLPDVLLVPILLDLTRFGEQMDEKVVSMEFRLFQGWMV